MAGTSDERHSLQYRPDNLSPAGWLRGTGSLCCRRLRAARGGLRAAITRRAGLAHLRDRPGRADPQLAVPAGAAGLHVCPQPPMAGAALRHDDG